MQDAVAAAARAFPELDLTTLAEFRSTDDCTVLATVSHSQTAAQPRRYRWVRGDVCVAFDGLPVDAHDLIRGTDAAELFAHWDALPGRMDGQFAAIRVDIGNATIEVLLDALGLVPVFAASTASSVVVSNSVAVVRALTRRTSLDILGASTMLTLGWTSDARTLVDGIRVLPAGHRHRWRARAHTASPFLTPRDVNPARRRERIPDAVAAEALVRLTRAAARDAGPVECAITAGRDTRACLALLQAAGVPVSLYTFGAPGELDFDIGRRVAAATGLPHRALSPDTAPARVDWLEAVRRSTAQTDGLASLEQVRDLLEPAPRPGRVAVKVWGAGGEMGRTVTGVLDGVGENLPGLRHSRRLSEMLLQRKLRDFGGLVTRQAWECSRHYVRDFLSTRVGEGWTPAATAEAWYLFERVGRFNATGPRRAARHADVFSPYCSLPFIRYCYALTAGERYREVTHRRLIARLAPALSGIPFETPWPSARRRAATPLAAVQFAGAVIGSARERGGGPAPPPAGDAWFERDLAVHRDVALAQEVSPLWEVVDRSRLEDLLAASPDARRAQLRGIERVLTLAWYWHGDGLAGHAQ